MKPRSSNKCTNNKSCSYSESFIFYRRLRANKSAGRDEEVHFHNVPEMTFLTPQQNAFKSDLSDVATNNQGVK